MDGNACILIPSYLKLNENELLNRISFSYDGVLPAWIFVRFPPQTVQFLFRFQFSGYLKPERFPSTEIDGCRHSNFAQLPNALNPLNFYY